MEKMELKPCPFCGGKAMLYGQDYFWVVCSECVVETNGSSDRSEAVSLWNKRHEPTCHLVLVDKQDDKHWECDECGASFEWDDMETPPPTRYCTNCGAKVMEHD